MKLVVKQLIEDSLRIGRFVTSENIFLRHFFILLEQILKHGLKSKKKNQELS